MLLGQADLCNKASMLELKELTEMKFHSAFMSALEAMLLDVYASLLPTASEYEQRKQLIHAYNMIVRSIFGNIGGFPVVEAFGSFIMDIFTAKSDLDLSISFSNSNATHCPRDQVVLALRMLAKVLYKRQRKGHLSGVLPVLRARVPVLKAVDCKTGIECDISVENKDGISRSLFFSIISSIDERFRIMSYLMKAWAKANDINSSKDHTMNSLSIISLVAFHFQTRDPPILPPFSSLLRDGTDITNLRNVVLAFKNFGARNKESIAELFVALLAKLSSIEKLWELGLCASIFEGSWISKTWGSKVGTMSVEDFLDRSQNFARSVGKSEMPKIYDCLRRSLDHLSSCMHGKINLFVLRSILFGSITLDARSNHIKTKESMMIKQKLPIQSVQPIVDISNHANRQKQICSESARSHSDTIITTNHSKMNTVIARKRKLPSNELVYSPADAIALDNHPGSNLMKNLGQKLPRPHPKKTSPKRSVHANAAGASSLGACQNRSSIYLPSPTIHPARPYAPSQPIIVAGRPHVSFDSSGHPPHYNPKQPVYPTYASSQPIIIAGRPHVSFDPSGHPLHYNPKQPVYPNMRYGPHHNQLIYASQHHPTAPVHLPYGSQGRPVFLGYIMHNTGDPQHLVPPRWFGSKHP